MLCVIERPNPVADPVQLQVLTVVLNKPDIWSAKREIK